MSTIEAHPVPVQPPQVPPRPALWVVIEPPTPSDNPRRNGWYWCHLPEVFDNEAAAQDHAADTAGSVIFRLPGSGEVGQ